MPEEKPFDDEPLLLTYAEAVPVGFIVTDLIPYSFEMISSMMLISYWGMGSMIDKDILMLVFS